MTEDLISGKQGAETIAAAFTDHLAVLIRLKLPTLITHRGRGRWRINTTLLNDEPFGMKIGDDWDEWKQYIHRCPDIVLWWVHYVKKRSNAYSFTRELRGIQIGAEWRTSTTQQFTMSCEDQGYT